MTFQAWNTFNYQNQNFDLISRSSENFFQLEHYKVIPTAWCSTACHRGHQETFSINANQQLIVDKVQICLKRYQRPLPTLNNTYPITHNNGICGNYIYQNLNLVVEYTGGILIAQKFLSNLRIRYICTFWQYETVYELIFDKGYLKQARDVSLMIEPIRSLLIHENRHIYKSNQRKAGDFIAETTESKLLLFNTLGEYYPPYII